MSLFLSCSNLIKVLEASNKIDAITEYFILSSSPLFKIFSTLFSNYKIIIIFLLSNVNFTFIYKYFIILFSIDTEKRMFEY